jgi:hypothetical protein
MENVLILRILFERDGIDGEFGSLTEKALFDAKGVKKISLKQLITSK